MAARRPPNSSGPPPSSEMRAPAPPPTAVLPAAPPEPARERRALAALAIAAVAAMVWITHPVGIGILLGTLNAFTMQPFYERMRARGRRPAVAAAIAVGLSSIVIVAVLAGISSLLVGRGVVLAGALIAALSPGAPARELVVEWTRRLEPLGLRAGDLPAQLRDAAAELAARAAGIAAFVASASFSALLGFFFVSMTTYFVLRHWTSLARRAEDVLPLHPRHTSALHVRRAVRWGGDVRAGRALARAAGDGTGDLDAADLRGGDEGEAHGGRGSEVIEVARSTLNRPSCSWLPPRGRSRRRAQASGSPRPPRGALP